MIEELDAIESWAGLARYILKYTQSPTQAQSFLRLAKDSRYNLRRKRFEFSTTNVHITGPRMTSLQECIGMSFQLAGREYDYQREYYWWPRNEMGWGFEATVARLKNQSGSRIHKGFIS